MEAGHNERRTWIIVLAIVAVALILLAGYADYAGFFKTPSTTTTRLDCSSLQNLKPPAHENATAPSTGTVTFLIVEADIGSPMEGINGSAYHLTEAWPVMIVHQGQKVVINVINCASSEPHGFAISNYFDAGIGLQAGQSHTLTFTANQKGSFRVFCNIFCSIHPLMQNGLLIVS